MRILRGFFLIIFLAAVALGVAYYLAGRAPGPEIEIYAGPMIGQQSPVKVVASAPGGQFDALSIEIQQGRRTIPVFVLTPQSTVERPDTRIIVNSVISRKEHPELQPGP